MSKRPHEMAGPQGGRANAGEPRTGGHFYYLVRKVREQAKTEMRLIGCVLPGHDCGWCGHYLHLHHLRHLHHLHHLHRLRHLRYLHHLHHPFSASAMTARCRQQLLERVPEYDPDAVSQQVVPPHPPAMHKSQPQHT